MKTGQPYILYLTNQSLTVFTPALTPVAGLSHDEEGYSGFTRFLQQHDGTPFCLVADVIEEDFRLDSVPHVRGKDRQDLVKRKLTHLFHATTHHHAEFQGRASDGRRDDQMLLSALTNEELLLPWIKALNTQQIPLQGIYSIPLISIQLIRKLGIAAPHQLLITRQRHAGMRQSYFQNEHLKFSRLTPRADEGESSAAHLLEETRRTRQYLESLRLLPRDQPLKVRVICDEASYGPLDNAALTAPLLEFELLPLNEAASRIGLKPLPTEAGSERLFLHLFLASRQRPNQYASPQDRHHYRLWQTKQSLYAASALLGLCTLVLSSVNIYSGISDYTERNTLESQSSNLTAQYESIHKGFPATPAPPNDIAAISNTYQSLEKANPGMEPLMLGISRALDQYPQLHVTSYTWELAQPQAPAENSGGSGDSSAGGAQAAPPPQQASQSDTGVKLFPLIPAAIKGELVQQAVLHGEIRPFQDYRSAQEAVRGFIATLGRTPNLTVSAEEMPLNENSKATLSGSLGAQDQPEKHSFTLKITVKNPAP